MLDIGSVSDMLIINNPKIIGKIKLRSHIKNNRKKISQLVKNYDTVLNNV